MHYDPSMYTFDPDTEKVISEDIAKQYIQKAYKGIMTFMSGLKSHLENRYPDYIISALYLGYMDMTYFAFTPAFLKEKKVGRVLLLVFY